MKRIAFIAVTAAGLIHRGHNGSFMTLSLVTRL